MKTPYAFQRYAIEWRRRAREERSGVSLLCLEQGLGKTLVTAFSLGDDLPVTLACPAFLQYNWIDELTELGYVAVLVRCQADLFRKADVFVMSFHFLVTLDLDVVKSRHFVVDEFHYARNLEAKRTQAVVAEIECIPEITLLSGTPIPSKPIEIYPILDALGIYTRGYYSFAYRFCAAKKTHWGLDVRGASNIDQLRDLIAPYMLRLTKSQVLKQLPPKTYRVLSQDLELPPEEKKYDASEFQDVDPEIVFETLSTLMRLHAAIKFPIVAEIAEFYLESMDKLIVFGHHREEMLNPLYEKFEALGMNPAYIVGGTTPEAKKKEEKKFQTDATCRIIIIGLSAGGVGLTLTAASRVLLAESSWIPGDIDQAADRAHRISQAHHVFVDIVTIRGSIDEYQVRRALEKLEVTQQLLPESELPMSTELKSKLESLRAIVDDIETLVLDNEEEEEEKPTRTRRTRGKAAEKDDEKPARTRRARGKAAEKDEEEEEKPTRTRRTRGKAADGDDEKPARSTRRSRSKAADKDDDDEKPARSTRRSRSKTVEKEEEPSPFDIVRLKASEVMKETDRATLTEILGEFDAEKVSDLDEADYEDFIAMCDEELEAQ